MVELASGIGLCLGPACGSVLYSLGGFTLPFWTFTGIFAVIMAFSLCMYGQMKLTSVDHEPVTEIYEGEECNPTYFKILKSHLALLANMSILVCLIQYTFVDPILASRLEDDFGISPAITGIFFLVLALSYAFTSAFCHTIQDKFDLSNKSIMITGLFGLGGASLLYGPI